MLALKYLFAFPAGTAYAVYAFWVVWSNEETALAFSKNG